MIADLRILISLMVMAGMILFTAGCKSDDDEATPGTRLQEETMYENDVLTRRWVYLYEQDKVVVCFVIVPFEGGGWDTTYHKIFEYPDAQTLTMTYLDHGILPTVKVIYTFSGDKMTKYETQVYSDPEWQTTYLYEFTYDGDLLTENLTSNVIEGSVEAVGRYIYSYDGTKLSQKIYYYFTEGAWKEVSKSEYHYLSGKIDESYDFYHDGTSWVESRKLDYLFYDDGLLEQIISYDKIADEWVPGDYIESYEYNENGKPSVAVYQYDANDIDRWEYTYETGDGNMSVFWYGTPEWYVPIEKGGGIPGARSMNDPARFSDR